MAGRALADKQAVRRDQIYASAARLIADRGFKPMTMRELAVEAGVSTGMVNHYFANKSLILIGTLRYVSERMQERIEAAIRETPPGEARLLAFLECALPTDDFSTMNWKVWTHAFAEASRSTEMRELIAERYVSWHRMWERVLVEARGEPAGGAMPLIVELDALLNGLVIHHLIVGSSMSTDHIRDALLRFVDTWHGYSPTHA